MTARQTMMKNSDILKPDGFRQSVFSLLLATLAINILSLALPVMTLQVYDRILLNPGTGTLPVLTMGVCLAIILETLLRLSRGYIIGRAGAAYEHRMACLAISKTLNADLSRFQPSGVGEYLNGMGSIGKLKDFYNGYTLTVLAELLFVPLFFVFIVYIGHLLALVPAFVLAVFIVVSLHKGRRLRRALSDREDADNERFNFLVESLDGIHTLKSFSLEKFFERRYEALEESSTLENFKVTQETAATYNSGAIFSHIMVAGVITAGSLFVLNGMLTTGGLIAILLLSGRIMQPVQKALSLWARYQDYRLAREHVLSLITTPQKVLISRPHSMPASGGHILVNNLSFRSESAQREILTDINLELNSGDSVFISGAHGAGKTVLLSLLAGIYPATGGHIHLDGEDINSFTPESLVRHVGYIRTRPLIFRGTIRDNITCFGRTEESAAREIAASLNVDREVAQLPGGFDTFLTGNNTDNIPQGVKQRISMARVLATKPRLILFDNADHAIDREGYVLTYNLLARVKGHASLILVTDDLNISALADRHYQLEGASLSPLHDLPQTGNIQPYRELSL